MPARALLWALAFAAGCTDAITYVALGNVFTANMTGNTVLLGIAVIAGSTSRIARSACAVAGFCVGVGLAVRLIGRRGELWPRRVTVVLLGEVGILIALALCAAALGHSGGNSYLLVALSGIAMGAQSAAVTAVGVRGISTTYITGTITGLVARVVAGRAWSHEPRGKRHGTARLAAVIWVTYFAAAVAGAAVTKAIGVQAIWIPTSAVLAVVGVAVAGTKFGGRAR